MSGEIFDKMNNKINDIGECLRSVILMNKCPT